MYPMEEKEFPLEEAKQWITHHDEEETITTGPEAMLTDMGFRVRPPRELPAEPPEELTIDEPRVNDECCGKDDTNTVWEDSSTVDGFSEAEWNYQCHELYAETAGNDIDYLYSMQESFLGYVE